jgi:chromosome segregation ATPase
MDDAKLEKLLDGIATGLARVEKKGDETNGKVETLSNKVEKLDASVTTLASDFGRLEKKGDETNSKVEGLSNKVEGLGSKVEKLDASVTTLTSDFGRLETTVATLHSDFGRLETTVATLHSDFGRQESNQQALQSDFNEFKGVVLSSLDRILKTYTDFAVEKVAIDATLHRHDNEIRNLQKSVDKLQQEIIRLRPPS